MPSMRADAGVNQPFRRGSAPGRAAVPRRAALPPRGAEPAQRLPGARRRHRHEHGAHPRIGQRRAQHRRLDGRGVPRDQPRLADGRTRQLGRDHVADPARARRGVPRHATRSTRATSRYGIRRGADAAYEAVMRPVEGTILTVVRETAEAVEALGVDASIDEDARARDRRRERVGRAHARAAAGVAATRASSTRAARASRCCSHALLEVVERPADSRTRGRRDAGVGRRAPRGRQTSSGLRYEVMYLLDAEDETMPAFRESWGAIGDSIVVVGGDGLWNCHIHTNDIGAAVEAGIDAGRPRNIRDHRPVRTGRRRAVGARSAGSFAELDGRDRARGHDRGRRGRRRRRRAPPAHEPRRAAGRSRAASR